MKSCAAITGRLARGARPKANGPMLLKHRAISLRLCALPDNTGVSKAGAFAAFYKQRARNLKVGRQ